MACCMIAYIIDNIDYVYVVCIIYAYMCNTQHVPTQNHACLYVDLSQEVLPVSPPKLASTNGHVFMTRGKVSPQEAGVELHRTCNSSRSRARSDFMVRCYKWACLHSK